MEEEQEALEEDELKQVVGSPPTLPDISPLDPPYVTARPSQPLQRGRFVSDDDQPRLRRWGLLRRRQALPGLVPRPRHEPLRLLVQPDERS